jgi:hypothetical protein
MSKRKRKFPQETVKLEFTTTVMRNTTLMDLKDDHNISHIQWESKGKSIFISFKGRKPATTWLELNQPTSGRTQILTTRPDIILGKRFQWKMSNSKGIKGVLNWTRLETVKATDYDNRQRISSPGLLLAAGRIAPCILSPSTKHNSPATWGFTRKLSGSAERIEGRQKYQTPSKQHFMSTWKIISIHFIYQLREKLLCYLSNLSVNSCLI